MSVFWGRQIKTDQVSRCGGTFRAAPGIILGVIGLLLLLPLIPQARGEEVTLPAGKLTLMGNLQLADGKTLADGVVLMTHGTLAHNRMEIMETFQNLLAERGISSLAITLSLGVDKRKGMYDCANPHRHRHQDAMAEIGQWLTWLTKKGAKKVALLGHSRGGNQTAWFAAEKADPSIKAVILVAPMLWDEKKSAARYQQRYRKPLADMLAEAKRLRDAGKGDELMTGVGFLYCRNASVTPQAFLSYYTPDPRRNTAYLLPKIPVPVLVIAGTEDKVVTGLPEAIKPLADGKRITFSLIEDADHFFRDFAAEDAVDAISEFLGRVW